MSTIIFDFDSTLISCESLEEILKIKMINRPESQKRITDITAQGMEGRISFSESVRRRLELVEPTLVDVTEFGRKALQYATARMGSLIKDLQKRGIAVHIVSGALREAILPAGTALDIPKDRIHGVQLIWNGQGRFSGIDPHDPFSISKVEGLRKLTGSWQKPRVAVGDGMTDYAIYEQGLVEHFIAFTQHVRRRAVIEKGTPEARNVDELKEILETWL
jgi:HAD superfamily phosphoserine phosphatase-like hydrolase